MNSSLRPLDVKLAPSILSADLAHLADEVSAAELGGADRIHIDVMDGHFVPNLTFGPVVVKWIRPVTRLPLETHLMIDEPDRLLEAFVEAGADTLIVHQEGAVHLNRTIQRIKALGRRVGVAINPATPAIMLEEVLPELDLVLVMTVNPGFGGQSFLRELYPRSGPSGG
jgi:ribulose-phosphate 3-epimerase